MTQTNHWIRVCNLRRFIANKSGLRKMKNLKQNCLKSNFQTLMLN